MSVTTRQRPGRGKAVTFVWREQASVFGFILRAAMRSLLVGLLAFLLTAAVPRAQAPPAGATPQISGRVFDARDGAPLRRARVTITVAGRAGDPLFTDNEGGFVIADAPRTFTLTVAKAGYTSAVVTPSAAQLASPL